MTNVVRRGLSFFIALMLAGSAVAQSGKGTITGTVVDQTGAVLQGAQIQLQPSGMVVASDQQGTFAISWLASGVYTLTVSYVGFKTFEVRLDLSEGDAKRVTAKMDVASQNEDVIVTAERPHGEAEAINRTRTADNIVQVLPAKVITSLPNANVADALGRLPSVTLARDEGEGVYVQVRGAEPRLTNLTINGISVPSPEPTVRAVRLDALPADLVESVEINKTLSANMDGDGIGGSVNLRTKTAADQPTFIVNTFGGYNPILGGRGNDQLGITAGRRFGAEKRLGVLVGGSYDYNGRGIDDIEPAINPSTSTFATPYYDNNTVREYRYYRTRAGFAGSGDYKVGQTSDLYVRGLYSDLKDYGDKWYYGPQANGSPKFYTSSKRPDYSIGSANFGGKHVLRSSWLTWELAAANAREGDSAGNPKADFSWIGPSLSCGYNPAAQTNVYTPTFGNGCDAPGTPLQNPANWGLKDLTTSTGYASQWNLSAAFSDGMLYRAGNHSSTLEWGAKFRHAHKWQSATETVYDGWKAQSYPMTAGLLETFSSNNYYNNTYYGGHYGPVSSFDNVVNLVTTQLGSFVDGYKTAAASYPNLFDLTEKISAAYVMNTVDFDRVRLQMGLRVEGTQMNTTGYNVILFPSGTKSCPTNTGCGVPVPVANNPSYVDALPSVSIKYAFTENSTVRATYSRGLARPDAYQLVPYATQDDSTNPATVAIGNPDIKPTHANNYDVLFERFLRPVGMIQAGFFYKQLSDPMVSTQYTPTSGTYAGQLVTQWINGGSASLYGFEASYQQHLSQLPGALAGLGVFANYSRTASHIDNLPGRTDSPALQRQAPNTWNVSPTYDTRVMSFRLGLTYNAPSIYQYAYQTGADPAQLGPSGPAGDQYTYPHLQVDAQATFSITHNLKAQVYGLNLSDEVYGLYVGSAQFVRQREFYKPTFAAGLRYVF